MIIHTSYCFYYGLNLIYIHREAKISSLDKVDEDLLTFLNHTNNEEHRVKSFFGSLLPTLAGTLTKWHYAQ